MQEIAGHADGDSDVTSETSRRLGEMSALLRAQQVQLEEQRAQIDALSARLETPLTPKPGIGLAGAGTRREVLRMGGAAVGAVGLAAIAGLVRPQPAEAAAFPLYSSAINAVDGETVIQPSASYGGNLELVLIDATNSQANADLRGLRVTGSGASPGISTTGGSGNGLGLSSAGGGTGGSGIRGVGYGATLPAQTQLRTGVIGIGGDYGPGGDFRGGTIGNAPGGAFTGGSGTRGGNGIEAQGSGSGYGALLTAGPTGVPLALVPSAQAGPPPGVAHNPGELMIDSHNVVWVCAVGSDWFALSPGGSTNAAKSTFFKSVITTQPTLVGSDGSTWQDMAGGPTLTFVPAFNCIAILSANADLFFGPSVGVTINQDLAIWISGGTYGAPPGTRAAWKENGGDTAYTPNAAFVQTVQPMAAGVTYTVTLRWKTNRNAAGITIYAGAGPLADTTYSPTSLTAQLIVTP